MKKAILYVKKTSGSEEINESSQYKIAELATRLFACKLLLRQAARSMDSKEKKSFLYSARTKWYLPTEGFKAYQYLKLILKLHE